MNYGTKKFKEYQRMYLDADSSDEDVERCLSRVKEVFYWEWLSYSNQYEDLDFESIQALNQY